MPQSRAEWIERLAEERYVVAPDQGVVIDRFRPADAIGIARLFFAVYGPEYPAEIPYVPEELVRANADGTMWSVVARTERGDVVGHAALHRSSPPNPRLVELGQGAVLHAYRGASLIRRLQELLLDELGPSLPIDAAYGEAVMHHLAIQRLMAGLRFRETGIELDLMPEGSFAREGEPGRVSLLFVSRTYHDLPQPLHVCAAYRDAVSSVLENDLGIERRVELCDALPPAGSITEATVASYASAGVLRANLASTGEDFAAVAAGFDARADAERLPVRQVFVSLHEPWAGRALETLNERGYFLVGLAPRWFDRDALVLQKLQAPPGYERIKLCTDAARRLLSIVRDDRERVVALATGTRAAAGDKTIA